MSRRKRIGLFVAFPEMVHVRRIVEGIPSGDVQARDRGSRKKECLAIR